MPLLFIAVAVLTVSVFWNSSTMSRKRGSNDEGAEEQEGVTIKLLRSSGMRDEVRYNAVRKGMRALPSLLHIFSHLALLYLIPPALASLEIKIIGSLTIIITHTMIYTRHHHATTQITFPSLAQTTLKQVKAAIAQSEKLGQIPVSQQRIFHLGRELKTAGRSLETLGVGRLGITILHVHAVPSKAAASSHNKKRAAVAVMEAPKPAARASAAAVGRRQRQQRAKSAPSVAAGNSHIVDLAGDSSDSDDEIVVVEGRATMSRKKRARRR